ncbi:MAG: bifunctional phosphoribosylaminoimidazolecarboxamide formyltransferase/IMP cyclohydrolase [Promicromonosporaceae bacterium]|nr:bifunctional phosphoribosylaminoimidazolecarboxamide formyltransferase/IMP cyclohydrolase [Promicromonosporaceae bacterium]
MPKKMAKLADKSNGSAVKPISRALVSVYDKTGLGELAVKLHEHGVEIVSTGSTAIAIAEAGVPVTSVASVTGFPEILNGRVKTLHPHIHAGLLADLSNADHVRQLREFEIAPFDLVVGNLYPFEQSPSVEMIDIGGPAMLRAAGKNFAEIAVIHDPREYPELIAALDAGGFTLAERRELAARAFLATSGYDGLVSEWLRDRTVTTFTKTDLRYGENPHQSAYLIADPPGVGVAGARQLQGKPMSYNNYIDADAAWRAVGDHATPTVAIIKHANPSGIAVADTVARAYELALATDPVSAFGSVVAANREVTAEMAELLLPVFTEVILAPSFEPAALELFATKKSLRVLEVKPGRSFAGEVRRISGGELYQSRDVYQGDGDDPTNWKQVSGGIVSPELMADLEFAWRAIRAVKSNAILLAKGGATKGVGMGQVNRVDAARLAVLRADELAGGAAGTVAASDAFFPFADGVQVLLDAGVVAIVQPGGSVRDPEVIAAAEAAGVPMFLTGTRHFTH